MKVRRSRKNRKAKQVFTYECSITGEPYKIARKVENSDELVSVNSYYELHPEDDDRPPIVKKMLGLDSKTES